MVKLGVNIDHIATVREARKACFPDPVGAAVLCEEYGCDSIVCHLREDRRHIHDRDVVRLRACIGTRLNLEMSVVKEIVDIACRVRPDQATLVPERRQEVTTEGGLDVVRNEKKIASVIRRLEGEGIAVSLFINPQERQIAAANRTGAGIIELHTGEYANAKSKSAKVRELKRLICSVKYARSLGLEVNAGHGLDYENARAVAGIAGMNELNIGYSIIVRALFIGLERAVRDMVRVIR